MKKNFKSILQVYSKKHSLVLATVIALALTGCTKNFEKYNTNPNALTGAQSNIIAPTAFGPMEQAIFSNYQRAQNLSADSYSGYMQSGIDFGTQNNVTYVMNDGWNSTGFNDEYNLVMAPVHSLAKSTNVKTNYPEMWGVALLIQVEAMSRVTDRFGPIPYSKVATSLVTAPYDDQQAVYQLFFKQIDTAVTNLKAYIQAGTKTSPLGASDYIYGGDYAKWLKFANSLRLRLAMRIVKADATTAQQQAEKAMADSGGLLTDPTDDAAVAQTGGRENDLHQICGDWQNTNLNASLQTYLVGYNDPRLAIYASPATADAGFNLAGKYVGLRLGLTESANGNYKLYAALNTTTTFAFATPQIIMTAAEVWFLKAEAALRGWAGAGTTQTDYEQGITTSMSQWGASIGNYLNDATSTESAYTDPANSANNSPAVSTITIKWDANATQEQQLERIITQKWLAIFPDGQEAWSDWRRTGYPKLFTTANNLSGGIVNSTTGARRLPYPSTEQTTNKDAYNNALTLLGGADNAGTRIWWDANKANF
jgi:hypothetical protein